MTETTQEKPIQRGLRLVINLLVLTAVGVALFLAWSRFLRTDNSLNLANEAPVSPTTAIQEKPPDPVDNQVNLPDFDTQTSANVSGIYRAANLTTNIPTRPRVDVITYTVDTGDSLFSIADAFNLKPETLLWGNYAVLKDDPHVLRPGQVLQVLPVDGTYYQWSEGDNLNSVADFFGVEPDAILEYPGNRFDLATASVHRS
jgi:LysM repeat protein